MDPIPDIDEDSHEDDSDEAPKTSVIRKRTQRDMRSSVFSSMITVPEDNSTHSSTNANATAVVVEQVMLQDNDHDREVRRGSSTLDDSFSCRSSNSLVNKMQSALNEEWWGGTKKTTKPQHPMENAPPVKTLLLSDTPSHQLTKKKRARRADCIFGIVLLTIGVIVGGAFIHRDKLLTQMSSLLSSSTTKEDYPGGTRALPFVEDKEDPSSILTYEERQQMFRMNRQQGHLRVGGDGRLGVDLKERREFVYGGGGVQGRE